MSTYHRLACLVVIVILFIDVTVGAGIGCYEDNSTRVWPYGKNILHLNTPQLCIKLCSGHKYAGVQYGEECHCGDTLPPTSLPVSRCASRCTGDSSLTCGGSWALQLHNVAKTSRPLRCGKHVGCFQDSVEHVWKNGVHSLENNSPQPCRNICQGHRYAGLQAGTGCMCGDSLPAVKLSHEVCDVNCPGALGVKCGGNLALNVYDLRESESRSSVFNDCNPNHIGCYEDNSDRVWKNGPIYVAENSPQNCMERCAGHKYFALQFGSQCFCGDHLPPRALPKDRCAEPCPGQRGATCGGGWSLEVYTTATADASSGGENLLQIGCFEDSEKRVWKNGFIHLDANSPRSCMEHCARFKYAGLQYGFQCHCGDFLPPKSIPNNRCSTPCPGQPGATCGGNWAMQVYRAPSNAQSVPPPNDDISDHIGCFADTEQRVWKSGFTTFQDNSPSKCITHCAKFKYAGVQFGSECHCGDVIPPDRSQHCATPCSGQLGTTCGGDLAMDVYRTKQSEQLECGKRTVGVVPLVSGGTVATSEELPWYVGIYRTEGLKSVTQICGASLITPSLSVTAAHCFIGVLNASLYKMAAGKVSRDWSDEVAGVQRRDVSDIFVHEQYFGVNGKFAHDIALMKVTSPFILTLDVNIVCVDWGNLLEQQQLQGGSLGTVAGWGITEENSASDVLRYIRIPYIPLSTCLAIVEDYFKTYLTEDKLCAGFVDRSVGVCRGDSGAGLVYPHAAAEGERFYLRGITSVGHNPTQTSVKLCNNQHISGFTSVAVHRAWIRQYVLLEYL